MNKKLSKLIKYANKSSIDKFRALLSESIVESNFNDLEQEFNVNIFHGIYNTTLLYFLIGINRFEMAEMLLQNGFNVYKGYDMIFMSKVIKATEDSLKYINLLINYGFDVNYKCLSDRSTLLHMACLAKNLSAVKLLIELGACAFHYSDTSDGDMVSVVYGNDEDITPLSLVNEILDEEALEIAILLVKSIPHWNKLAQVSIKDLDDLLKVAIRKNSQELLSLFKMINYKNCNKGVLSLKEICRTYLRIHLASLKTSTPFNSNFYYVSSSLTEPVNGILLPDCLVSYLKYE